MAAETGTPTGTSTIRPFQLDISDKEIADLRQRITSTRWPSKELDPSQGVQLATL